MALGLNGPTRIYETGRTRYATARLEAGLHGSSREDCGPNELNPHRLWASLRANINSFFSVQFKFKQGFHYPLDYICLGLDQLVAILHGLSGFFFFLVSIQSNWLLSNKPITTQLLFRLQTSDFSQLKTKLHSCDAICRRQSQSTCLDLTSTFLSSFQTFIFTLRPAKITFPIPPKNPTPPQLTSLTFTYSSSSAKLILFLASPLE